MGSENKRIVQNSIILYGKLIITSIISLFTARYVIHSLGLPDFGLYSVVGGMVVILNIMSPALTSASYRYIAFEMGRGDTVAVNKVFNISLVLHIVLALIFVLLAETIGRFYVLHYLNVPPGKVGDAMFVFSFSVLAVICSILCIPFQGLVIAHEKFAVSASIDILSSIAKVGAVILLVYYAGNRLRLFAVLTSLLAAATAALYVTYCWMRHRDTVRWNIQKDRDMYREMLGFSGWLMIGGGASLGNVQGAALLVNVFFGTVMNAAFGIANQVNGLVLMVSQSIGQAAIPQITKSYSSGNPGRTMQIVCFISKYSFFMMLLPALPILLETQFLLGLWLHEVPPYTSIFCRLMVLNALANCLSAAIPAAVQATGKIKYFQIICSAISLSSLPVAFMLFKLGYPPYTMFVTFIGTTLVNVVICQALLKRLLHFDVRTFVKLSYLKILYVILAVSPLFVIRDIYPDGLMRFLVLSVVSVIWLLAAMYVCGMEETERNLIRCRLHELYLRLTGMGAL